jgi:hypothetical protein
VHEDRPPGRQFARLEGLGFAIVGHYLAEFVFLVEIHDMPPIQY